MGIWPILMAYQNNVSNVTPAPHVLQPTQAIPLYDGQTSVEVTYDGQTEATLANDGQTNVEVT